MALRRIQRAERCVRRPAKVWLGLVTLEVQGRVKADKVRMIQEVEDLCTELDTVTFLYSPVLV